MPTIIGRPWIRAVSLGTVGVLALGATLALGADRGNSAQDVRLLSGAAWLPSTRVGQLTLLDGTTAEVAGQVQVAPTGNALSTVQMGHTAYTVDRTLGSIRRVDGVNFHVGPAQSPIQDAHTGLTAFAGTGAVYLLDTKRGVLATLDPTTLLPRGEPVSLAAELTEDAASVDEAGRLWVVDNSTGDLTRVDGTNRTTRRGITGRGHSVLTIADQQPVIVNMDDRKAIVVDPGTGAATGTLELDLRRGDTVRISGSPRHKRLHVVASRGVLTSCDLTTSTCGTVVPLSSGGNLGAPVESGNKVFVPDYASGQVWIIDLATRNTITTQVLTPPTQFQLLARDGMVFFNDPETERAGVIHLDGTVVKTAKYDPKDPNKGLNTPSPPPTVPNPTPTPQPPTPTPPPPTTPAPTPSKPTPPPTTRPAPPPPPAPPVSQLPPTTQPSTPPTTPVKPVLRITLSKARPAINEPVTLQVSTDTGATPASAQWDYGDGQQGTGLTATHQWTTAKTHQVSVLATMPDGQQLTTSTSLEVTPPPTVDVPNVVGKNENAARTTISNANLVPAITRVASNTVPAGVVISQNPTAGTKVSPGSTVTATVSSGKRAPLNLITAAPQAAWRTASGAQPFKNCNDNADPNGFALSCPANTYLMENGSSPAYLEMHPQWVDFGWIEGTYTLPVPIIAGDRFRSTVGFIQPIQPPSAGEVDFVVSVIMPNGGVIEVHRVHDRGADGILRTIDVDLTPYTGATKLRLHVDAGQTAAQDWACWIAPTVGG